MKKKSNREMLLLIVVIFASLGLFLYLYQKEKIKVEEPLGMESTSTLSEWTVENSNINGAPLVEDKSIYERNNNIYDVYITVFPTKDENGEILDFSAFSLHQARDHSYNPTLNCNIQILNEGEQLDPLLSLDVTNATIRVRGNSSRGDLYKSYRIKLGEEAGEFMGQTSLNLNKHVEDRSKVTTKFCTDVLQEVDNIAGYRTNFMRVWIRDVSTPESSQQFEYYGLFTHTEQPNKSYLEARGLSSNAVMYKARDFSFQIPNVIMDVNDPNYSEEAFEMVLGIREGDNHEKLIEMVNAVNDETRDIEDVMATYFNEENYLTFLAFSLLMGAEDILNHNYILYSPNASQTWYIIPWDFDSNMSVSSDSHLPVSLRGGQKLNLSSLHSRYFRIPGNLEKIQKRMEELMDTCLSRENIRAITDGYTEVLEKTMMLEPDIGLLKMQPNELLQYIQTFPDLVEQNYQEFLTAFQYPAPMYVSLPVKNSDGSLHLAWDNSFSYQGRTITYNVQIANDCYMEQLIYEKKGIAENTLDVSKKIGKGTYYLKVTAVDSEGNEQVSLEHYEFAGDKYIYESGVLEFTIE